MYLICLSLVSDWFSRRMVYYLTDTFNESIPEIVLSRSFTLQLHIEVLNISYLLVVRASISTECTLNPWCVWQVSYHLQCILLLYHMLMIQFNLFVNTKKQEHIRNQEHLMIIRNTLLLMYSVQYSYYCTIKYNLLCRTYFLLKPFPVLLIGFFGERTVCTYVRKQLK